MHPLPQSHIQQQGGPQETVWTPGSVDVAGSFVCAHLARRHGRGRQADGRYLPGAARRTRKGSRSNHNQRWIEGKLPLPAYHRSFGQYGKRYINCKHYHHMNYHFSCNRITIFNWLTELKQSIWLIHLIATHFTSINVQLIKPQGLVIDCYRLSTIKLNRRLCLFILLFLTEWHLAVVEWTQIHSFDPDRLPASSWSTQSSSHPMIWISDSIYATSLCASVSPIY